jgi:hypothetical protein
MKAASIRFLVSAAVGYILFAAFGWAMPPTSGTSITASDAATALSFSFPGTATEATPWHAPNGTASRGWIIRRAYVHGYVGSESGTRYSEQVLKVGWPFTVVRGFIRSAGPELRTQGACFVDPTAAIQPVRMLPAQPVWPGILFVGLAGVLVATVCSQSRALRAGPARGTRRGAT